MTIQEQLQRMSTATDRGIRFIEELNAAIEFKVYANGVDEAELAEEMLVNHLKAFDVTRMSVSEKNYRIIKKMQKDYHIIN